MEIKIQKEKAIEILEECKNKIMANDFDATAWKAEAATHLEEIFTSGDRNEQIKSLKFYSNVRDFNTSEHIKSRKITVQKLLQTYIDVIKLHVSDSDNNESDILKKENFELKFQNSRLQDVVNKNNQDFTFLTNNQKTLENELTTTKTLVRQLENDTVQLTDITLEKLWLLLKRLPLIQFWGLIVAFFAILGLVYWFGTLTIVHS